MTIRQYERLESRVYQSRVKNALLDIFIYASIPVLMVLAWVVLVMFS